MNFKTRSQGRIVVRTILGDRLLIDPEQVDGEKDINQVFYYDVPIEPGTSCEVVS